MMINLLDEKGDFNKIAVDARAKALHRASISRGDKGETSTLEYWLAYCWRIARQQHELHKKFASRKDECGSDRQEGN